MLNEWSDRQADPPRAGPARLVDALVYAIAIAGSLAFVAGLLIAALALID